MIRPLIITITCLALLTCGLIVISAADVQSQGPQSLGESFDEVESIADSVEINTSSEPQTLIRTLVKRFLTIVSTLALALVVWGGFVYLTSAGDETRASKGKKIILGAIIGLIIIGLSAVIVNLTIGLFSEDSSSGGSNAGSDPGADADE